MPHSQRRSISPSGSHHHHDDPDRCSLLPAELIAEIIGFISDETTLVTCQQISKAFRYPARKKLFYAVTIGFPSRAGTVTLKTPLSLYMKVARFPDIAKIIQRLVVNIGLDREDDVDEYAEIEAYQRSSLQKAIPLLTSLNDLKFPQCGDNVAKKWTVVPFFPLMTPAQASNITVLDISALRGYQFPSYSQLAMFDNLKWLALDPEGQKPPADKDMAGPFRKHSLVFLQVAGDSPIKESIDLILSPAFPFDIPRIQAIDFIQPPRVLWSRKNQRFTRLTELLLLCKNLTMFWFRPCPIDLYHFSTFELVRPFTKDNSPPTISGLQLERIVVGGIMCNVEIQDISLGLTLMTARASPLGWIIKLFETVPPEAPIPLKEVMLHLVFVYDDREGLLELLTHQWEEFRKVVMSSRFPQLKKVYIQTGYEDDPPVGVRDEKYPELTHPALDEMQKAGLLTYLF